MKFMVIDGNSILNRAFYGIRLLTNHEGLYTNAIYGFLSTYFKLQDEEAPDRVIVCFDRREKTFRHEKFDTYKAQRKGMPDELAVQLPVLKDVLDAMGVTRCELAGYEADDLLGTISRLVTKQGNTCVIVTGDKDSLQLIGDGTTVLLVSSKGGQTLYETYDENNFRDKYGFEPIRLIDLKSLMGDSSDNITGVPGVGEKTAMDLLHRFGSLAKIYQNIEDVSIKKGIQTKLKNGEQSAKDSFWLATIDTNVPLPLDVCHIPKAEPNEKKLTALLAQLEFKNFLKKLKLDETEVQTVQKCTILTPTCYEEMQNELNGLPKAQPFAAFIPIGLHAICLMKEPSCFLVLLEENCTEQGWHQILQHVFSGEYALITHDAKELVVHLLDRGFCADTIVFDTCIGAYLLNPTEGNYDLQRVALSYLNEQLPLLDFNDENIFSSLGDRQKALTGIARYTDAISKLFSEISAKIEENHMEDLYYKIEHPLITILADMQCIGCKVDAELLHVFGKSLDTAIAKLTDEIYEEAGETFNINSTKILGGILFDKLGLPAHKKTKTGYSTNADVLEELKGFHPIIEKILEYRQVTKLKSTYVDGLLKVIRPQDGRIHSHFQQTVTATGRLSSTDPNLQNIPVRTDLGRQLRKMFVAENAQTVLIDADYSQIELRVLAHIAQDQTMIQAFREGQDIHAITASQIFHIPLQEVTPQMRSSCKAVNFGIVYGISDFSLAQDIGVTKQEAGEYIAKYLDTYHGVKNYMDNIKASAKEKGYVETLFGRRRYLPELNSQNYNLRSFGARVAMNTPIQGTAADIIKIAMVRVWKKLKAHKYRARLILQVHDELIIEAPIEEQEAVMKLLREEMEGAMQLDAPLIAEAHAGYDWYMAKG